MTNQPKEMNHNCKAVNSTDDMSCKCFHNQPQPQEFEKEFFERFGADKIWVIPSKENVETILEMWGFIRSLLKSQQSLHEAELERVREIFETEMHLTQCTIDDDSSTKDLFWHITREGYARVIKGFNQIMKRR